MKRTGILVAVLVLLPLTGFTRIGGPAIIRDRFDYSVAISESWKSQMLLNIVKIRYSDTPVFMDVTSVINLVGMQNTVNLAAGWSFPPNANTQGIAGTTRWAERPTITYAPLTGEKFTRSLLTPITPYALLTMVHAGQLRIIFHTPNWEDFVHIAFRQIRLFGAGNIQITRRLREMVESLTQNLPGHRHPALCEELDLLDRAMASHHQFPENLALARIPDSQGLGATSHKRSQE